MRTPTGRRHLSPGDDSVGFVAHEDHGKVVGIFDLQNLLLKVDKLLERAAAVQSKDEQKALAASQRAVAEGAKVILADRMSDLHHRSLVIYDALLSIDVWREEGGKSQVPVATKRIPDMVGS